MEGYITQLLLCRSLLFNFQSTLRSATGGCRVVRENTNAQVNPLSSLNIDRILNKQNKFHRQTPLCWMKSTNASGSSHFIFYSSFPSSFLLFLCIFPTDFLSIIVRQSICLQILSEKSDWLKKRSNIFPPHWTVVVNDELISPKETKIYL